jgi:tetratricopeptide (TPR) repeat protein
VFQIEFADAKAIIERNRAFITERSQHLPASIRARIDLSLVYLLQEWGEVENSGQLISAAAAILRPYAESPQERWELAMLQSDAAMTSGRHEEADVFLRERLKMRKLFGAGQAPFSVWDHMYIALNFGMQGRFKEATQALDSAPNFNAEHGDPSAGHRYVYASIGTRARLALDAGDPVSALTLLAKAIDPDEDQVAWNTSRPLIRGEALCILNQRTEGLTLLQGVITRNAAKHFQYEPLLARTRAMAGLCALADGKRPLALQLAAQAREAFIAQPGVSPYYKVPSEKLDRLLGVLSAKR